MVVRVAAPVDHGTTRAGHRRIVTILGGEISGGIDAVITPGGADWQLVRPDGTVEIDGRYSATTPVGELLYLRVAGVRSGPKVVLDELLHGGEPDPSTYYFRTVLIVETSAPRLAQLEHAVIVASCVRTSGEVRYSAYRVG